VVSVLIRQPTASSSLCAVAIRTPAALARVTPYAPT
jgi:hypothetical protein